MNIKDRASRIRQLKSDPVFTETIEEIRTAQVAVFLRPHSSEEDRAQAHEIIRALSKIDEHFDTVFAEEILFDKQQKGSAP
jgi:hypothetical protein